MPATILKEDHVLTCHSPDYNWVFNTNTGKFRRWGKYATEDPVRSPIGPEILDIEVSTVCSGSGSPCPWCYKGNTKKGHNMSYERFVEVLSTMSRNLTQVAFGIGDIDANPDLWRMMEECRARVIAPNITINGYRMTAEYYQRLAMLCKAVAVSHYEDDVCREVVARLGQEQLLLKSSLQQVNIHKLLAQETIDECFDLIRSAGKGNYPGLNAIVFLVLKPKGPRNNLTSIVDLSVWKELLEEAFSLGVSIGFDSCSAPMVLKTAENDPDSPLHEFVEPCESGLFSAYVNVHGEFFPCSFSEGVEDWKEGIYLERGMDFVTDVWYSNRVVNWNERLITSANCTNHCKISNCRACPVYDITPCKKGE